MTDDSAGEAAWFASVDAADLPAASRAIEEGSADEPADWPALAVDAGAVADEATYYDLLREATLAAARAAVERRERAGDAQLIHAVRAMDDCERTANEIAERVASWGGSREGDGGTGIEYAREVAAREPDATDAADEPGPRGAEGERDAFEDPADERLVSLAQRAVDLADEGEALRAEVERAAPAVAPNLAAMAGPVLAARLIALAGGLEDLAKSTSGTVQVLGAEDALFAHLRGDAPSPKHGVIFTHEYVRGTHPEHRGSAARALAGKLTLAARVDHYSGERKPELDEQLDSRLRTIRARTGDAVESADGSDGRAAAESGGPDASDAGGEDA